MLNIFGRRVRCETVVEFDQAASQPSVHYRASQQQHTLTVSKSQPEEKYHCLSRQEPLPPPLPAYLHLSVFITEVTKQPHLLVFYLIFKRCYINKGIAIMII